MKPDSSGRNSLDLREPVLPIFVLTLAGTLAWISAVFLAPFLRSRSSGRAASFLYAIFSPLCHQIPARCFYLHGFPLAVCGRCLGIYAGFLAGLMIYPFVRGFSRTKLPPVWMFLALSLPMGLDALGGMLRIWETPLIAHFLTGFLWGAILPYYFITGVAEIFGRRQGRKRERGARPGDTNALT